MPGGRKPTPVVNVITGVEYPSYREAAVAAGVKPHVMMSHLHGSSYYCGKYQYAYKRPPNPHWNPEPKRHLKKFEP